MAIRPRKTPAYRLHKVSGQAIVWLDGRDHYLGKHGSPESVETYNRLVGEWMTAHRILPRERIAEPPAALITVAELLLAFRKHCLVHYRTPGGEPTGEVANIDAAIRVVRQLYGLTPAVEFGPLKLRTVRERMIATGLMRTTINARINRIRRAFKWATSVELVPVAVVQALGTVAGLGKGRSAAQEPSPVMPVPIAAVEKTLPFLPRPVAGLVRFQLLTGMRPGEACSIRGCDIRRDGPTWTYLPGSHKTSWRGKVREIVLGPQAQALLTSFAKLDMTACLFDPREAVAELHAKRAEGRKTKPPKQSKAKAKAGAKHSQKYNRYSYLNAVTRACKQAGVEPWTPNQLRHTAATEIRARFGLEAAQLVLGHANADTTQIYAERDLSKLREIMKEVG